MSDKPNSITRTSLADHFDACDESIKDFNDSKRDAMVSYRVQLENAGWAKDAIKAEIEAVKTAIRRRRLISKDEAAVEAKDALVDEVLAEITSRAPRATRVATTVPDLEDHDPETGEVLDTESDGRKLSVSTPAAAGIELGDSAPSVERTPETEGLAGPANAPDAGTANTKPAHNSEPVEGAPADEAETPQVEASSVPHHSAGGENVAPEARTGEVETHASPAINPNRPHCLKPKSCASINWKAHCYTCSKEHADAEGFAP